MNTSFTLLTIIGYLANLSICAKELPSHILTLNELYDEVKGFARRFPLLSTLVEIGTTYEQRSIYCLVIHDRSRTAESTVLLDFGTHAREWASPASGLYLIKEFLTNTRYRNLIQTVKWIIIPVMNPDGYYYSTVKAVRKSYENHRFWKKNRRPLKNTKCFGVDLNRNYPAGYESNRSVFECEDDFSGPEPLSELETQAMDDLLSRMGYVDAFVAVHACSQSILLPYAYKKGRPKYTIMKTQLKVAYLMRNAMAKVAGTEYKVLSAADLYVAGGVSGDYAFANFNVPVVFTLELGYDSEDEEICFHPGPNEMSQLERESLAAFIALGEYLSRNVKEVHKIFDPYARKANSDRQATRAPYSIYCFIILNILLIK